MPGAYARAEPVLCNPARRRWPRPMPSLCANVIFLLKETSVFSAVAMADLMYVAKDLIGMYYKTDEALTDAGVRVSGDPAAHFHPVYSA